MKSAIQGFHDWCVRRDAYWRGVAERIRIATSGGFTADEIRQAFSTGSKATRQSFGAPSQAQAALPPVRAVRERKKPPASAD